MTSYCDRHMWPLPEDCLYYFWDSTPYCWSHEQYFENLHGCYECYQEQLYEELYGYEYDSTSGGGTGNSGSGGGIGSAGGGVGGSSGGTGGEESGLPNPMDPTQPYDPNSLYYYLNYENRSWVCMNILSNLNSLIEKECFLQYWDAIGDMELSTETMGQIEAYIKSQGINYMEGMDTVKIDGGYYFRKSVDFYNSPEFNYAFGTATVYFDTDGKLVGFSDNYNFDWKFWWEKETRTGDAELATRFTSIAGFFNQAQAYNIYYGVHE